MKSILKKIIIGKVFFLNYILFFSSPIYADELVPIGFDRMFNSTRARGWFFKSPSSFTIDGVNYKKAVDEGKPFGIGILKYKGSSSVGQLLNNTYLDLNSSNFEVLYNSTGLTEKTTTNIKIKENEIIGILGNYGRGENAYTSGDNQIIKIGDEPVIIRRFAVNNGDEKLPLDLNDGQIVSFKDGKSMGMVSIFKANLNNANLARANFHNGNLSSVNFNNSNLNNANFSRATLTNANLSRATLTNANLANANLSRATLTNANLSRAALNNANLASANLQKADLKSAKLKKADLSSANLNNSNFKKAVLSNAKLNGAKLVKADLSSAKLTKANLISANLQKADLSKAKMKDANFSKADLKKANLSKAKLIGANLSNALLKNAKLKKADLISLEFIVF